jgi:acyl transferase domain-containing protein
MELMDFPKPYAGDRHLPVVFMFSGQGSHYYQMAAALYLEHVLFRRHLDQLDATASALMGVSVVEHVYHPGRALKDPFTLTRFSHPGIFMIECALANTLADLGLEPDLLMGASMGTFVAAAIGGSLGQHEALAIVIEQARLLERYCEEGAMLAVLAPPSLYDESAELHATTELAGINMPNHFVVSGHCRDIAQAQSFLDARGVVCQQLNVSHAFHSRHIQHLRPRFLAGLAGTRLRPSRWPIVCNARAEIVHALSHEDLWDIAVKPIRFRDSVAMLESSGSYHYVDLGPSGTLATFVKYCLARDSRSSTHAILTPFGNESPTLNALVERFAAPMSAAPAYQVR